MSRKFTIEVDDKIYEELQKGYVDAKKINSDISFEDFISEILTQYINVKKQTGNILGKFSKAMLENFDPSQLDDMLSSLKNMGEMFNKDKESEPTNKKVDSTNNDDHSSIEPTLRKKS